MGEYDPQMFSKDFENLEEFPGNSWVIPHPPCLEENLLPENTKDWEYCTEIENSYL